MDFQRIRLQEVVTDESREEGRMPRTIECELVDDLVDSCVPGDDVTVTGTVKVVAADGEGSNSSKTKSNCLFLLYIDSNSITNMRKSLSATSDVQQFSVRDLAAVREIANLDDVLYTIVNSICPAIYGHELVKSLAALT